jgi:hypothetical protein
MFFRHLTNHDFESILNNKIVIRSDEAHELHAIASFSHKQMAYKQEIIKIHNKDIIKNLTTQKMKFYINDLSAFFIKNVHDLFLPYKELYFATKGTPFSLGFQFDVIREYINNLGNLENKHLCAYFIGKMFIWKYEKMWKQVNFEHPKSASRWFSDFYQKSIEYFSLWEELNIKIKLKDVMKKEEIIKEDLLHSKGVAGAKKRKENIDKNRKIAKDKIKKEALQICSSYIDKPKFISLDDLAIELNNSVQQNPDKYGLNSVTKKIPVSTIKKWVSPIHKEHKEKNKKRKI